jgi:pyruvate-formate lyase-activating enzyme
VLLISGYELGHQPLAVAEPAAILRSRGHDVRCLDLSVESWEPALATWADKVGFSVPMHTAARLARSLTPAMACPVAWFGLYAAMGADIATPLVDRDPTGALLRWVDPDAGTGSPGVRPARDLLPGLDQYAHLVVDGTEHTVAYTEASRGCAHRCRHCPVPVVYDGRIRINEVDQVLADVAQQVDAGATHLTFGDPDFLNGPHHAVRVVRAVNDAFPDLTFDCTVKVEHILRHSDLWGELAARGCVFVVSAFESVNDAILERLDKGHTAADAARAVALLREVGIPIRPSWLPFTPWSSLEDVRDIFAFVTEQDIIANVDPVQYTIRLLVPKGSLLIGHIEGLGAWDADAQSYRWHSGLDPLQAELATLVERSEGEPIGRVYDALRAAVGMDAIGATALDDVPRLTESWFCCAEPTAVQLATVTPEPSRSVRP